MENLSEELISRLGSKSITLFGGIQVPESVVVTWIIMALLVGLSLIFVRNLKPVPQGAQIYVEIVVGEIYKFLEGILGEDGKQYIPYLGTVLLYIGVSNIIGLIGFTPPTKDLNTTAALSIMSIILIEYAGIKKKGIKGFLKSLTEPAIFITPLNVFEILIRPLSLCMRLFGNVLGAFVMMELIKIVVPVVIPIPFSVYFDIFDGLLQAYIFVFLTALFMKEQME